VDATAFGVYRPLKQTHKRPCRPHRHVMKGMSTKTQENLMIKSRDGSANRFIISFLSDELVLLLLIL